MHQTDTATGANVPVWHGVRRIVTRDADEQARNLTGWEQHYDQVSGGLFHGALTELRHAGLQVFREDISQAVRQSCRVPAGAIWFGFPSAHTRINGRPAFDNAVMVRPGGGEFELVTPGAYKIHGIVIERAALASSLGQCDGLPTAEVLQVDAPARERCVRAIEQALVTGSGTSNVFDALTALIDCRPRDRATAASFERRRRVVAMARDYIEAHRDRAISIPELCTQTHVSRRTLQYCFEEILGMSPVTWLRVMRLNGVRRHLQDGAGRRAIGDVAASWGLDNFSQFCSDYRKLFGEPASAAVARSTSRCRSGIQR